MFIELSGLNWILLLISGCMNVFSFSLFYIDKQRAIKRKYRISEKTLLISSFSLGGIGAWMGMKTFRHKTKHTLFIISLPIAAAFNILVMYLLLTQKLSIF